MPSRPCVSERKLSSRVLHHFTGRPTCARRIEERGVFRIGLHLHAEAAADVVREHADRRQRNLEDALGQQLAHHRDALRAARSACSARSAGSNAPMPARGSIALGASRVSISRTRSTCAARANAASTAAASPSSQSSAMLPGAFRPDRWRILRHRALDVRTRAASAIELDAQPLRRRPRLRQRLRDHDGDRLADVADAVRRQHRHRGREHRLAVAAR